MTQAEQDAYWASYDDDKRPCLPEPPELIDEDWKHAGELE